MPRTILYDNLKSVVLERVGDHIRFHPRLLELAGHYHFAPQPCAVARGNEKGRVERMIRFLRHAFFAARRFSSVDGPQRAARPLDRRRRPCPAGARRAREQRVAEALAEEQPRLCRCPSTRSPATWSAPSPPARRPTSASTATTTRSRTPWCVGRSPSSPPSTTVRLLDGATEVARHARSYDRGQRIEDDAHLAALAAEKRRAHELRGRDRLRQRLPAAPRPSSRPSPSAGEPLASETTRLLRLLDQYGAPALDAALADALARGALSAASVAHVLDQRRRAAPPAAPARPSCSPPIPACATSASRPTPSAPTTPCSRRRRRPRSTPDDDAPR